MLSKNQIKLINQLNQKKYRKKHGLFFAEGIKTVKEFLNSPFELEMLYQTADLFYVPENRYALISENELHKISQFKTPQSVLALFKIPDSPRDGEVEFCIALDGVRDPGNLGTIIRLCDWFGVDHLICSEDTVDCYNPKVVQSSMGSLARVNIIYTHLKRFLQETPIPIFGTFMDGEVIYEQHLPEKAIIVMGNEANGISREIENLVSYRVSIPQFGRQKLTESLNVATATSIILNEFKRW